VELNKTGAPSFNDSVSAVFRPGSNFQIEKNIPIIDTRSKEDFKNGFLKGSINLQDGEKFETWLGSIIGPAEQFYLVAANDEDLDTVIKKAAKIGYEQNIKAALLAPAYATEKVTELDLADFRSHPKTIR
jgi:hydroxyacylglutathione hydrolase